jgi:hypothetical protein
MLGDHEARDVIARAEALGSCASQRSAVRPDTRCTSTRTRWRRWSGFATTSASTATHCCATSPSSREIAGCDVA